MLGELIIFLGGSVIYALKGQIGRALLKCIWTMIKVIFRFTEEEVETYHKSRRAVVVKRTNK